MFLRRSQDEAWFYATTTLRKAGRQLQRNVEAVKLALDSDPEFRKSLGLARLPMAVHLHGWIVDTSVECDHQHFNGFLKVGLEEILIALRDDRRVLSDPRDLLQEGHARSETSADDDAALGSTLYPNGFGAARFVEVVESEAVWDAMDARRPRPLDIPPDGGARCRSLRR